jgi:hypothetical protein
MKGLKCAVFSTLLFAKKPPFACREEDMSEDIHPIQHMLLSTVTRPAFMFHHVKNFIVPSLMSHHMKNSIFPSMYTE